jgi:hypothetical protein
MEQDETRGFNSSLSASFGPAAGCLRKAIPMASHNRMMTLVAFLQAQNCSNLPGSWRHPATALDFLGPEYYQRIARTLEDGKIQMAFFDDRLALPELYTGDHRAAVAAGCGR